MTKAYVLAGQAAPAANISTTLYTVPAGKQFVASTLVALNRSDTANLRIRIAIHPSEESIANQHYVEHGRLVPPSENRTLTWGMTFPAGTRITVQSSTADASFSLFGALLDA